MTETRLRELLSDYVADEPPLRLTAHDVVGAASRSARPERVAGVAAATRSRVPWLAAASVVLIVTTAAWGLTRGGRDGAVGGPSATTTSAPSLRVPSQTLPNQTPLHQTPPHQTPPERMLTVMRELARAAFPAADLEKSRTETPVSWAVEMVTPDRHRGLSISVTWWPAASLTPLKCEASPVERLCGVSVLPDGRQMRDRYTESASGDLAPNTGTTTHEVVVRTGDVEVVVTQSRLSTSGLDIDQMWPVSSEDHRRLAADPRLVPMTSPGSLPDPSGTTGP